MRDIIAMLLLGPLLVTSATSAWRDLTLDTFVEESLPGGESAQYRMWISTQTASVKVVLLPLVGDADALVSFDANATMLGSARSTLAATWPLQGHGIEELLLRRDVFCQTVHERSLSVSPSACFLFVRVRGYLEESTRYKIGVLDARDVFSAAACAPGCSPQLLSNRVCDAACNVTACAFDRGACVPQLAAACSPGCQPGWIADGECDDACAPWASHPSLALCALAFSGNRTPNKIRDSSHPGDGESAARHGAGWPRTHGASRRRLPHPTAPTTTPHPRARTVSKHCGDCSARPRAMTRDDLR